MIPTAFRFSQSSLQDYADCPRRFQLRYLEEILWPALESEPASEVETHQLEGLVFHRLVQQHRLGLPPEGLATLANTPNLRRWWSNYISGKIDLDGYACHPELTLSCAVGAHRLLAKYDLLAVRDGQARIYDWKTYARRPRDEWLAARWQTRIYPAVLVRAGAEVNNNRPFEPEHVTLVYWFADFPDEPAEFKYDAPRFGRDWSAIERIINEASSTQGFPLTEDQKACRFCVYRSYCDRGDQAGLFKESEADAEPSEPYDLNFEQIGEIEF